MDVCQGRNESVPSQADTAAVRPARAVDPAGLPEASRLICVYQTEAGVTCPQAELCSLLTTALA